MAPLVNRLPAGYHFETHRSRPVNRHLTPLDSVGMPATALISIFLLRDVITGFIFSTAVKSFVHNSQVVPERRDTFDAPALFMTNRQS